MFATEFEYKKVTSVSEAIQLLGSTPGAKLIAGGDAHLRAHGAGAVHEEDHLHVREAREAEPAPRPARVPS